MANIKFSYLYRDSGNYKNYGFLIFSNPDNIDLSELTSLIKSKLFDGTWFYHKEWHLPDLRSAHFDYEIDPTWHEFESVEYTDELINTSKTLTDLMYNINLTANNW